MFDRAKRAFGDFLCHVKSLYSLTYDPKELEKAREEVAKRHGLSPEDLDVPVEHVRLPTIVRLKRAGRKVYADIGKVLGAYSPELKRVYLEKGLKIMSFFNPDAWRMYLENYVHELTHAARDLTGKLKPRGSFSKYIGDYDRNKEEQITKKETESIMRALGYNDNRGGSLSLY